MHSYLLFTNLAGELTLSRNGSSISGIPLWQTIESDRETFFFSITVLGSNLHTQKINIIQLKIKILILGKYLVSDLESSESTEKKPLSCELGSWSSNGWRPLELRLCIKNCKVIQHNYYLLIE